MPWAEFEAEPGPVLVLVRHGRTQWNAERRFLGRTDIPLDEVGMAGAQALGRRLRGAFDAIYSSPLARARQTAEALGPVDRVLDGLAELGQGVLEGLTMEEGLARHAEYFERWMRDPSTARVPGGGESLGDVRERAVPALQEIVEAHPSGRVAVVTHQMVIATLCCHVAGAPLQEYRRWTVPNLALSVLVREGEGLRVAEHGWAV